ncbi:MAG: alpha/beta hydrolase [Betaproteobacteria bacterium]|nr:alpha/beta hydrolase [Betaproteobacteria bacterium]
MTLKQDRTAEAPSSLLPPCNQVLTRVGALAVRDTGPTDPPDQTIVLWPSILADYRIYRHPIEVWRGRHRIIAIDGPGHGDSGRPPGAFSMNDCGQALGEILDALTLSEPVVVVGTSWGGLVAGEFALLQPKRTLAVVMLNTPVIKARDGPSLSDRFVVWGARWIHSTAAYRNGVAKAFFLPATIERGGVTQEEFHQHLRQADGAALSQAVRSVLIDREPLADRMNGIKAPTLFVAGRQDSMYPVDALKCASEALPNGHFEVLDTAHISVVDDPVSVTARIDDFLQRHIDFSGERPL